ncbi:MAG: FeoB-associated Cys-rich membrane protein [Candidatus Schekmanbacteria bacterium]|nr:FeoB-associated Cys-rich membrane protein [Candidatus Schekmanbacteria bacterium]
MKITDIILSIIIIAGALFLLYRSLFKKKGYCPGCDHGDCKSKTAKSLVA